MAYKRKYKRNVLAIKYRTYLFLDQTISHYFLGQVNLRAKQGQIIKFKHVHFCRHLYT